MLDGVRQRLSYANVMSTAAVFIALGGSSYAAMHIGSPEIANNSVRGVDVRNRSLTEREIRGNALTGRSIRESRLGRVPHAREADLLGGLSANELVIQCPPGTFPISDVCVEVVPRVAQPYGSAVLACGNANRSTGPGRRLPTHGELRMALTGVDLALGGELTSEVIASTANPGQLEVLFITDKGGSVAITTDTVAGEKAFRCVADPLQ